MDVIEVFEGRKNPVGCLLNRRECSDKTPCTAHRTWRELNMAYSGFMLSTSIAVLAGLEPPRDVTAEEDRSGAPVALLSSLIG